MTTADLRVGQGYVRCGRCSNVFNALLTLSEEPGDSSAPAADSAASTQSRPALQMAGTDSTDSTDSDESTSEHAVVQADDSAIESDSSNDDGTGTLETIVLEGDTILQTEEFVPEADVDSKIAALSERLNASAELHGLSDSTASELPSVTTNVTSPPHAVTDVPVELAPALQPRRRLWPWTLGAAVLLLLLGLQAVHHWRNALATEPLWNGPLTRVYAAIGLPLEPNWDLSAYDVRQQGASADPQNGNTIRVRISLANHAHRAQPLPILRLTLLDRYGKRVAARDLKPVEYLPGQTSGFIGADQRIDTQVAVQDPGTDASSFEVDVCLQLATGLHCATDAARASG